MSLSGHVDMHFLFVQFMRARSLHRSATEQTLNSYSKSRDNNLRDVISALEMMGREDALRIIYTASKGKWQNITLPYYDLQQIDRAVFGLVNFVCLFVCLLVFFVVVVVCLSALEKTCTRQCKKWSNYL